MDRLLALATAFAAVALAAPGLGDTNMDDLAALDPSIGTPSEDGAVIYYDALDIGVEGKGWTDTGRPYDRLPAKAEGVVRQPVWDLSHHSAGLCVRFVTDATTIHARWKVSSAGLAMDHMPATGMSGLDLYARGEDGWHWVGVGRPTAQENSAQLVTGLDAGPREFRLYLPLYNGTESLEIGIPEGDRIAPAPAYPEERAKPICFWGTSIVQGGCASRTGMAYPAIFGRWLDRPTINLGFSGNGQSEPEMAELLAELDVAAFVLDCLPNLTAEQTAERTGPAVRILREARPDTPIVLVENITYQQSPLVGWARESGDAKNAALRAVYEELIAQGIHGLIYVPGGPLLGDDGEGTVDGTHPTDLGFLRMAGHLRRYIEDALTNR